MRHLLHGLLLSTWIVAISYFVFWGCIVWEPPCFTGLQDIPTAYLGLMDGVDFDGRTEPTLIVSVPNCINPEPGLTLEVNGQAIDDPADAFVRGVDATSLLDTTPQDLVVIIRDSTATWNLEVAGYLQRRGFRAESPTVARGAPLTFEWTGNVLPATVDGSVRYADGSTQAVTGGTNALTITPPADAGLGTATLEVTVFLEQETATRCDGPRECIIDLTMVGQTLSFDVVAE